MPHRRIALYVARARGEVFTPTREVATPCLGAEAVGQPHGERKVRVRPPNHDLPLLTRSCFAPAVSLIPCHVHRHNHIAINPGQRPTSRVRLEWLVYVGMTAAPYDTAVLCRPVRVNIIGRQMRCREAVHRFVHWLGAKGAEP